MSMTGQHPGSTLPATGEAPPLVVVVVGDSRARTRALRNFLSAPGFVVAAEVCTAREAEDLVEDHRPGAVLVDLDLHAGGLEVIERIMAARATPIVVCGPAADRPEVALAAGAVDVVGALDAPPGSAEYVAALRRHLRVASRVKVITHPRATAHAPPATATRTPAAARMSIIAIGASTGGPPALATILAEFPADLPQPSSSSSTWPRASSKGSVAGSTTRARCRWSSACDGERLRSGVVHLAPANKNLIVQPGLRVSLEPPVRASSTCPAST